MHDAGISQPQISAALEAVSDLLTLADIRHLIEVHNFGLWREPHYRSATGLRAFQSVDWYIEQARREGRGNQLNADTLIDRLAVEPWRRHEAHYDLFLVSQDLFSAGCNFVVGLAMPGIGTIVSSFRFAGLDLDVERECLKTAVLHEFGHVLGLPNRTRGAALTQSLGNHCTNECVMRQGLRVPHDWLGFTRDRLQSSAPLCALCLRDLRNFFRG